VHRLRHVWVLQQSFCASGNLVVEAFQAIPGPEGEADQVGDEI